MANIKRARNNFSRVWFAPPKQLAKNLVVYTYTIWALVSPTLLSSPSTPSHTPPFHLQPSPNHRRGSSWPQVMVFLSTTRTLCRRLVHEDRCWCKISYTWMKWPTSIESASRKELSTPKELVSIRFCIDLRIIVYRFVHHLSERLLIVHFSQLVYVS